jgi:serine/threonine-protein kinase HipA
MSVGDNRHYRIQQIVPRHFLQTAAAAGIGAPAIEAIFEDLAANAINRTDDVIAALPHGFPGQLVASVRAAVNSRIRLLAEVRPD